MERVHTMASGLDETITKTSITHRKKIDFVSSVGTATKRECDSDVREEPVGTKKPLLEASNEMLGTTSGDSYKVREPSYTESPSSTAACGLNVFGNKISLQQCSPVVHLLPHLLTVEESCKDDFRILLTMCKSFKVTCHNTRKPSHHLKQEFWKQLSTLGVPHKLEFKSFSESHKCSPNWKCYLIISNVVCATCVGSSKKLAKDGMMDLLLRLWKDYEIFFLQRSFMAENRELGFKYEMIYTHKIPERIGNPQIDQSKANNSSEFLQSQSESCKIISAESILENLPYEFATHELNCIISAAPKLPNFVLFQTAEDEISKNNPVSRLVNSASMCKVPLEFGTEAFRSHRGRPGVLCTVTLCSRFIATGLAVAIKEAKYLAAHNAISALKMTNPTLRKTTKKTGPAVGRDELTDASSKEKALPETNVGHKLLTMMGWKGEGAGLGRKGEGIADPVKATGMTSRSKEGLGFDLFELKDPNTKKLDEQKVWQFLQDYARSDQEEELVFTSEFTLEERKKVHAISLKLGLKSKSKGKGKSRYLTVGRKWDMSTLIRILLEKGGSMGNYELVGPSL